MARIADKHGLTNRYREGGSKRVVKRGRPRKYLFGAPRKKYKRRTTQKSTYSSRAANTKAVYTPPDTVSVLVGLLILFLLIPFLRCLSPFAAGGLLLKTVGSKCKEAWGVPAGLRDFPLSWAWLFLTILEMVVCFVMIIIIQVEESSGAPLLASIIVYLTLSVIILYRKRKEIIAEWSPEPEHEKNRNKEREQDLTLNQYLEAEHKLQEMKKQNHST